MDKIAQHAVRPLLVAAVIFGWMTAAPATAQQVCFPKAKGVPFLPGPPSWTNDVNDPLQRRELNEPRWRFGPLRSFFNDAGQAATGEGGFRAVVSEDGTELSISIQNKADSREKTFDDGVTFGLYVPGRRAVAVRLPLYVGAQDPNYYTTAGRFFTYNHGGGTTWSGPFNTIPSWIVPGSVASWSRQSVSQGGADWGIQFKVKLTDPALNILPTTAFRVHVGMHRPISDGMLELNLIDPAKNLASADYIEGSGGIAKDPLNWHAPYTIAQGCPEGLEFLSEMQIGVEQPDGSLGNVVNVGPGKRNVFVAKPFTNGVAIPPSGVLAQFRIANWGAQPVSSGSWDTLVGGDSVTNGVVTTDPGFAALYPDTQGLVAPMRFDCLTAANASARTVCGVTLKADAKPHQCMSVEIRAAPTRQVPIKVASIYRNMRFEGLSTKVLPAEISIRGLQAQTGRAMPRDVYLSVVTRNMPPFGDDPLLLNSYLMNLLRSALLGVAQAVNPLGLSLSLSDQMKVVWPSYEVHAYYETGRTTRVNGKTYKVLSPMNSFGYYFSHEGPLFGFTHGLGSPTAGLQTLGTNLYKAKLANEGTLQIQSGVTAQEVPKSLIPALDTACEMWSWACQ